MLEIERLARQANRRVMVCFVLRFAAFYRKVQGDHRIRRAGRDRVHPGQRRRHAVAPGAFVRARALGGRGEKLADDPVEVLPRHGHRSLAGRAALPARRELRLAGVLPSRTRARRRAGALHRRLSGRRHLPLQRAPLHHRPAVPLAADGLRPRPGRHRRRRSPRGCAPARGAAASIVATTTRWTGRSWRWSSRAGSPARSP